MFERRSNLTKISNDDKSKDDHSLCACSFYYLMPGLKTRDIAIPALWGRRNQVLMFASEDDATRFALMLEAQDFPPPQ